MNLILLNANQLFAQLAKKLMDMNAKNAFQEISSNVQELKGAKSVLPIRIQAKMGAQHALNAQQIQKQMEQVLRLLMHANVTREGYFKAMHAFNVM